MHRAVMVFCDRGRKAVPWPLSSRLDLSRELKLSSPSDTKKFGNHQGRGIGPFPAVDVTPTHGIGVNPVECRDWQKGITRFPDEVSSVGADYGILCRAAFSRFG